MLFQFEHLRNDGIGMEYTVTTKTVRFPTRMKDGYGFTMLACRGGSTGGAGCFSYTMRTHPSPFTLSALILKSFVLAYVFIVTFHTIVFIITVNAYLCSAALRATTFTKMMRANLMSLAFHT